jgi:hypothetical protein
MRIVRQGICLWAVALISFASLCHAQSTSVTPEDEFKQKIRVSQDIQPLGEKPFGENISLYNGSLSFTQTDVDAPVNGPDLLLTRTFTPADLPANQYYVSYPLQEQVNGGGWATIQTSSATSKALSGKANGSYGYRVQACNAGGCGPWSSTGTITVALVPAVPTGAYVENYMTTKIEGYRAH